MKNIKQLTDAENYISTIILQRDFNSLKVDLEMLNDNIMEEYSSQNFLTLIKTLNEIAKNDSFRDIFDNHENNKIFNAIKLEGVRLCSQSVFEGYVLWLETIFSTINFSDNMDLQEDIIDYYLWNVAKYQMFALDTNPSISWGEKLGYKLPQKRIASNKFICVKDIDDSVPEKSFVVGIPSLDEIFSIYKQGLFLIAARPSVGKSMLCLYMAASNLKENKVVLYVSLEMSNRQTKGRLNKIAQIIGLTSEQLDNFFILDSSSNNGPTIGRNIETFAKLHQDEDVIVIIDPINNIRYSNLDEWGSLRKASKDLKAWALEYKILIVSPCAASRDSEVIGLDMSQLYGSATLEQDADIILGLVEKSTDFVTTDLEYVVLKNRDSVRGLSIKGKFNKNLIKFE